MTNPKKKIEIIFYLIKRMSPTEKRYFKLNSQAYKGSDKDFIRLFDFLNSIEIYDRKKIEGFFDKSMLKNKNLCISYLLDRLVDNMDDGVVYLSENVEKIIMPGMKKLRTYIRMELMDLAYKELLKVEKLAEQYELHEHLYNIYNIRENIVNAVNLNNQRMKEWEILRLKRIELNEKTKILDDIIYRSQIFVSYTRDNQKFKDAFDVISQYSPDNFSPLLKMMYNNAYFLYYSKHRAYESAYKYCADTIDIFQQNTHLIDPYFETYLNTWQALFMIVIIKDGGNKLTKHYVEYQELPKQYKKVFAAIPVVFLVIYEFIGHIYEVSHYIKYKQYEKIEKLNKKVLNTIEKYPTSISRADIITKLFIQLAYGFILLGNRVNAQFWMDKMLKLPYIKESSKYWDLRVIDLIILYEEESFVLLKSKIRSLKRQWKEEKRDLNVILLMIDLLDKTQAKRNQNKLPDIWRTAHKEILKIESIILFDILYSTWVAQKMAADS